MKFRVCGRQVLWCAQVPCSQSKPAATHGSAFPACSPTSSKGHRDVRSNGNQPCNRVSKNCEFGSMLGPTIKLRTGMRKFCLFLK